MTLNLTRHEVNTIRCALAQAVVEYNELAKAYDGKSMNAGLPEEVTGDDFKKMADDTRMMYDRLFEMTIGAE